MKRLCPVCGSDDPRFFFRPSRSPGPIVKCNRCHFVYISPIQTTKSLIQTGPVLNDRSPSLLHSSNLDEIEGSWEQPIINAFMRELAAKQKNAKEALAHIDSLAKKRSKLLDIGCFCGVFLSVASQHGYDCYGLEPLVMPAIFARGQFGLKIITDVLKENTYPHDFFDVVTAFQVFEHLLDPAKEIAKIRPFLKQGGLLVVEVPNIDTLTVRILRARHRHFVEDHVSFFSADTLGTLVESMGFKIRKIYYPARVLSLQHLAGWIQRYVSDALGNRLSQLLRLCRLGSLTISLCFGDIVTIIAEKEPDPPLH
jgi:2-polyprenyl-3-methyl-5-hydroxy-6-metoxy-1,4-benzoquinol methylase